MTESCMAVRFTQFSNIRRFHMVV